MTGSIYPCFWHNGTAKEAADLYIKTFGDGSITDENPMVVHFTLFGQQMMGLNGGPMYTMNPSISLFVTFEKEEEVQHVYDMFVKDGKSLMPCQSYPWAKKYGWVQDKFGLSWQLSCSEHHAFSQKISPLLMFTRDQAGHASDAMKTYTSLFPESGIDMQVHYEEGEGDKAEYLKHAQFHLGSGRFMAMDSSAKHEFGFTEGISLVLPCDGQEEVDRYWDGLVKGGQESQCGWLKDKYGVSWQIVPKQLIELLGNPDKQVSEYAMQSMLSMRKIIIEKLKKPSI